MRYTATFWALVRLLSCFSVDLQYLSCARGGEGYSIHLRVPGGGAITLTVDASWRKLGVTGTNFFSANHLLCQSPQIWLRYIAQPVGGCTYCAMRLSTKKC